MGKSTKKQHTRQNSLVVTKNRSSSRVSVGPKKKPKQAEPLIKKKKSAAKKDEQKTPQRLSSIDKTLKKKVTANSS